MAYIILSGNVSPLERWKNYPAVADEFRNGIPADMCLAPSPDGKHRCCRKKDHSRGYKDLSTLHVSTSGAGAWEVAEWFDSDHAFAPIPNPVQHNPIKPIADPVDLSMKTGILCEVTIEEWDLLEDAREEDYERLPTYDDLEDRRKR